MAENNVTYETVLKRWVAKSGIQYEDLLTAEADLFKQYAQFRLRYIWEYLDWPEVVDHFDEPVVGNEVEVNSNMSHILGVWDCDPYENNDAQALRYQRRQDYIVVRGEDLPDLVHVVHRLRVPDFDELTDEVPARFGEYIAQGAYADYLRTEGDQRAQSEEARAEYLLNREVDIFEREEGGGSWGITRNVYTPSVV